MDRIGHHPTAVRPRKASQSAAIVHDALIRGADSAVLGRPGPEGYRPSVAKRVNQLPQDRGSVLSDVVVEDGSRASNRRVPMEILSGLDGDGVVGSERLRF